MNHKTLYPILILILFGCSQSPTQPLTQLQMIPARDQDQSLVYRAHTPLSWTRSDPIDFTNDTTKHNCEFWIPDPNGPIRVTIHTFPVNDHHPRVPPNAQIHRWKEQFDELNPLSVTTTPTAHGGFIGLHLEAEGILNDKETKIMGWSMQLAPEYDKQPMNENQRADFTIKVVGNPHAIENHKQAICLFSNSFELIDELPNPL